MEKDSVDIFRKLKEDITAYVETKFEFLKLDAFERTGKVIAVLSYALIILFLAFFALLFLFLALGSYLGTLFNSVGTGYGIVFLTYLIAILVIILCKNKITIKVQNVIIKALTANDDNDNESTENEEGTDTTGEAQGGQAQT